MEGSVISMRYLHAPDGGMIPGSLCQGGGDVTTFLNDVDCGDCHYILEKNPIPWDRLAYQLRQLRGLL